MANPGRYAAQLNAGGAAPQPLGPLVQVAVQRGDTLTLTAAGQYAQPVQNGFLFSLGAVVAGLLHPAAPAPAGPEAGRGKKGLPLLQIGVATGLPALAQLRGGVPKGYARLLVFNTDSVLVSQHLQQLSKAALNNYESVQLRVLVPQDGYVTAYVGNESDVDVLFDDVTVEHRQGLQVQENNYDPAGLELAGLAPPSPGLRGLNQYRFNGKEFQADLGLNWNHQDWRFLDPQLLRWHVVDPEVENAQESWSPYAFGFDNAVRYADANGREPDGPGDPPGGNHSDYLPAFGSGLVQQVVDLGKSLVSRNLDPVGFYQSVGSSLVSRNLDPVGFYQGMAQDASKLISNNPKVAGTAMAALVFGAAMMAVPGGEGEAATAKTVSAYEVGTYSELKAASAVGDGLDIHHVVQHQPAKSLIPGYQGSRGPAIALPKAEHQRIPTSKGTTTAGSARSQLAKDIRDLRNNTSAPNSSLQKLVELNKKTYPKELRK